MSEEYAEIVQGMKQESLRSSLYVGARSAPDTEARLQALADRVGLPVDAVRRNQPDVELHDRLESFDYEKVIQGSPKLAAWLADPANSAVAHDDVEGLAGLEQLLAAAPAGFVQGWDKTRQMRLNYNEVIGRLTPSERAELAQLDKIGKGRTAEFRHGAPSYIKAGADVAGMLAHSGVTALTEGGLPGLVMGVGLGAWLGSIGGPGAPVTVPAGAAAMGLKGLAVGTAARYATGTYEGSVGEVYGDLKDFRDPVTGEGIDPMVARYAALIAGMPNAGLEFASLGKALKVVPGWDKLVGRLTSDGLKQLLVKPTVRAALADISTKYAVAVGTETFTEGLQKVVSVLAREAAQESDPTGNFTPYNPEQFRRDAADVGAEAYEAFKAAVTLGGLSAGVKAFEAQADVRRAQQNENFFRALGDNAKATKLRERLPDRFKKLIDEYTKDGPVQQVLIPAERFAEYFQTAGIDPAQVAQEVGATNFAEALAAGSDVVIPIGDFTAKLAPSDHLQGLLPDLRLRPGEMTPREAEEAEKNREQINRRIQAEIDRINEAAGGEQKLDTAIQRVVSDAEKQLAERYDPETARSMATILRGLAMLATRANPDADPLTAAESLWAKYGLTVDPLAKAGEAGMGGEQFEQAARPAFTTELTAAQDGQTNHTLTAVLPDGKSGTLEYAVYQGRPSISMISVPESSRRHGIGTSLVQELQRQFPDTEIEWGMMTADGAALRDSLAFRTVDTEFAGKFQALDQVRARLAEIEALHNAGQQLNESDLAGWNDLLDLEFDLERELQDKEPSKQLIELYQSGVESGVESAQREHAETERAYGGQAAFDGPELGGTPIGDLTEIEVDGVTHPALNSEGRPIHPTQEGIRNFWRWFGDSKVVDSQGRPLVVYHQTDADFSEFLIHDGPRSRRDGEMPTGAFFKPAPNDIRVSGVSGMAQMPVYLAIRNPALAESREQLVSDYERTVPGYREISDLEAGINTRFKADPRTDFAVDTDEAQEQFDAAIKEWDDALDDVALRKKELVNRYFSGSDGLIVADDRGSMGRRTKTFVAFSPKQIKSAIGNRGTFSPDSGNILYQTEMTPTAQAVQRWHEALKFARPNNLNYAPKLDTPTVLREMGVKQAKLELPTRVLVKVIHKHPDVPADVIEHLPALLADPLVVYPHKDGGLRVVIDAVTEKGEPIVVGVGDRIQTITPIHDKDGISGAQRVQAAWDHVTAQRGVKLYARNKEAPAKAGASTGAPSATIALRRDSHSAAKIITRAHLVKRHGSSFYQASPQRTTAALGKDALGSLQIGADRRMRINLFEKANLSTFLHEVGHFYLEVMGDLAEDPNTSQQVKDDYAAILKFLGASDRTGITREMHETFARANEAYLMEGKAPSPELRGVFQRFRAWLKLIYRELSRLDVDLSDEVRGVFDRIYATDAEIERAEAEANLQELFLDAEAASMTEAEFAVYRDAVARQSDKARDELQQKLMRIERLKREAWWKEERAKVAGEVAAEYDATPAAQAFARLTATEAGERLNRAQLVERYGADILKRLPRGYGEGRGSVYTEDGQDIDSLAEVLGYASVDNLVQALSAMPRRARFIAEESDRRMMERHGDLLNDVAIADAAMEAIHNEQRETVLKIELQALNREIKGDMVPAQSLKAIARGLIGQKQVRDINPHAYLVAERKASRQAFEAMAKGDYAEAAVQKQRELLNHYLYLEAVRARAEADKIRKYMDGFSAQEARQRLAKAGKDYLDQIDALLERYEFQKVTLREIGRRESLAAWLAAQEAEGEAVAVPLALQDESRRINWKQAPMDELRALRDAVRNIAHLASLKTKLMRKRKAIDFDKVVAELLGALQKNIAGSTEELDRPSMKGASIVERGAAAWRKFDAAHLKTEQLVEWLDGGDVAGPWARYFFDLADDAQTQEYDLHAEITTRIEALSSGMPKAWRNGLLDRTAVRVPGFSRPLVRYELISAALNMGNAQNLQRLHDGYSWSEADLQRIKDALTDDDMRYVQGLWDAIETLWPHLAALEERVSGLAPEKVVAQSIIVNGKTYRGGYYPLVYDPRRSNAGEKQAEAQENVQSFVAHGYGRPGTDRGATKQRQEKLNAPPLLDYEQVVTSHLAKVIKDVSHREAVLGMAAGFRSMPLSRASYTLIFLFLCLHTLGAHYTYSEVPCDRWWQRTLGFSRDGRCAPTHG